MRLRAFSSLTILSLAVGAGCQANPPPTVPSRTVTITIPVPVADKAVIGMAADVFENRLTSLGVGNFTVSTGDTMKFTMQVPVAIDTKTVQAVLLRHGIFELVPWATGEQPPNPGDQVPATLQPLVDATEFKSAAASTDSMGEPALKITLGPVGKQAFATYTTGHVQGYVPLVLDGIVLSAPSIQSPITGGEVLISGPNAFPIPLAAIIAMINAGPLPDAWTAQP